MSKLLFFSKILRINTKYNILYVAGGKTPGPTHGYTMIYDTKLRHKRAHFVNDPPHMPTFYPDLDADEPLPEEISHESLFDYDSPSIEYEDEEKDKKVKGKGKG